MRRRGVRAGVVILLALASIGAVPGSAGDCASGVSGVWPSAGAVRAVWMFRSAANTSPGEAGGSPTGPAPGGASAAGYDTSVPARCSASDVELETLGAAACPAGSRLGGGTTTTKFLGGFPSTATLDFFNNTHEQIILVRSPVLSTVSRGHIARDGSVEFASPTCFPYIQPPGCAVDTVLQLQSSITVPAYTRVSKGVLRSYLTTPASCPAAGNWENPIRLWWSDGSVDTVVTQNPCTG